MVKIYLAAFILGFAVLSPLGAEDFSKHIGSNICSVITFANANGSVVKAEDLFHCHVISEQRGPDVTESLNEMTDTYAGLLCHAHEFDNKRLFLESKDNVNIVVLKESKKPSYLGLEKTAYAGDLKKSLPNIVSGYPKMVNQINFYKLSDRQCGGFKNIRSSLARDIAIASVLPVSLLKSMGPANHQATKARSNK